MTIFGTVKRLCTALECLVSATEALRESVVVARDWHAEHGNIEARLEELERERHLFQAEVHGELLKAQAEYRKAGNAEKRAQTAGAAAQESDNGADETPGEFFDAYQQWLRETESLHEGDEPVSALPGIVEATASIVDRLKSQKRRR